MDKFSSTVRSKIMSKIGKKNTKAEVILRKTLWKYGIRGYRIHYNILGCPDIIFLSAKIAIFIDGDFWHGYLWKYKGQVPPKHYWQDKIMGNMARDKKVNRELKKQGWNVVRIWEHEVLTNPDTVANKIIKLLSTSTTLKHNCSTNR